MNQRVQRVEKAPVRYPVTKLMSDTTRKFSRRARSSLDAMFISKRDGNRRELHDDNDVQDKRQSAHYNITSIPPPNGWHWTLRPSVRGKKATKPSVNKETRGKFNRQPSTNLVFKDKLPLPISLNESTEDSVDDGQYRRPSMDIL
uniref:Uncharacterized protein n=1 Tax=Aplanochytrium stocchinoi TaxID=215587 RepID=A0A7S3LJG1_9STRA